MELLKKYSMTETVNIDMIELCYVCYVFASFENETFWFPRESELRKPQSVISRIIGESWLMYDTRLTLYHIRYRNHYPYFSFYVNYKKQQVLY